MMEKVKTGLFKALEKNWRGGVCCKVIEPGHISIGDDVQIGTHSYVLPGVTIYKGALISTHSVVQEDIPEYTIVAGTPARAVGIRN